MTYTPRAGSHVEAAINYIKQKGSGSSSDIALAIGIEQKNVCSLLQIALDHGALVACDVEIPGKAAQKEYRIGSGMAPVNFRQVRAVDAARGNPVPSLPATQVKADPPPKAQRKTVAKVQKTVAQAVIIKPAEIRPKPHPKQAPDCRCAILSDGSMLLLGDFSIDAAGNTWLTPSQLAIVVAYLRKTDHLQEAA